MTFLRSALALFFIFTLITTAEAQLNRPMAFDTYRVDDGLAGNWVQDMVQDSDGNMWIATNEGLSKYDGYSFKNYRSDKRDSSAISSDLTLALALDKDGNLWVKTALGLDLYDPTKDSFLHFYYKKLLPQGESLGDGRVFSSLFTASDGTLYLGLRDGMLIFNYESGVSQFFSADSSGSGMLRSARVADFAETAEGKIFVSGEAGIDIFDPRSAAFAKFEDTYELASQIPSKNVGELLITNDQVLWVGMSVGGDFGIFASGNAPVDSLSARLWTVDLKTDRTHQYKYWPTTDLEVLGRVTDLIEAGDGTVWLTRLGGVLHNLYRHIPETKTFQAYGYEVNNASSIAWNYATALCEDQNNDLWIGTSRGVSKSNSFKSQFNSFSYIPGQPFDLDNLFYSPTEIAPNKFLFTHDAAQIAIIWDRVSGNSSKMELNYSIGVFQYDSIYTQAIWTVFPGVDLRQISLPSFTYTDYENTAATEKWTIFHVLPLSSSELLLSTNEGYWKLFLFEKRFELLEVKPLNEKPQDSFAFKTIQLDNDRFLSLKRPVDADNNFGSNFKINLQVFDLTEKRVVKEYRHDLSNGSVTVGFRPVFFEDSKNRIWMGGTNAMISFDPSTEQFKEYPGEQAYNGRQVVSAFEDNDDNIWFNSQEHISRLDPETGSIQSINKSDGLITFRLNNGASILTRSGEVIFAGVGGLTYFDPRSLSTPTELPNILISSFRIGSNKINVKESQRSADPIEIASDHASIDIEFKSISFRNAALTAYRYKLEGWQDDWQDAGTRRFVQFTNLPPGKYTFMVSATNSNGLESAAAATISFTVLPPWWRTWWAYVGYIVAFALIIFAIDKAMRRRLALRQKEKDRQKELAQAKEIEKAYHSLEVAHSDLKAAQEQLVQQEKLASLGQLTAGIAHEIKNPLNFVNNFSELNIEMVDEAMAELDGLPGEKADPIKELLTDVRANLQKILQHGTRADGIVKSMLQHSRGGSGKKEPTDLNALLREYVNLAFHGMRASKNPINVKLNFDLDEQLGMVNLIGEDFSRVVLNLANNAFDAMRDKGRTEPDYKPELTIRSKHKGQQVEISIADNGPGIPIAIKDKILQPFFTTKKGTEGTGLGLSITNDIIKAHGGTLDIQSKPGLTVFQIIL